MNWLLVKSSYQINVGEMLLCMAYLRRTSQVAALAYSNFFFRSGRDY